MINYRPQMSENTRGKIFARTGTTMCVCVPTYWDYKDVEEFANQENILDNFKRWFVDEDAVFFDGNPNPCACNEQPAARRHWLLFN